MPNLFRKKPPPQWYILRPGRHPSDQPNREGPYTRATITSLYAEGQLSNGVLIWTNERIFPDPEKPNKTKPVRIMEWRRIDQIPDPVFREIASDAARYLQYSSSDTIDQSPHQSLDAAPPSHMPPSAPQSPSVSGGGGGGSGVQVYQPTLNTSTTPAAPSVYPVGTYTAEHNPAPVSPHPAGYPNGHQPAAYPQ